jgi:hypothetical protein
MRLCEEFRRWIILCENDEPNEEPMDWQEALEEAETPADIARILDAADAEKIEFPGTTADPVYLIDTEIVLWDGNDIYPEVENIHQWLSMVDLEPYFPDHEDRWNQEFWRYPAPLYHATTNENVASILKHGLNPASKTRGISNRSVGAAVFTTSNYEETKRGSYGNVVFEIDTQRLAKHPQRPYAAQEPDISEYDLRMALAHQLGQDRYETDIEGGMSPDTVILYGTILPEYLTQMTD